MTEKRRRQRRRRRRRRCLASRRRRELSRGPRAPAATRASYRSVSHRPDSGARVSLYHLALTTIPKTIHTVGPCAVGTAAATDPVVGESVKWCTVPN